MEQSFVSQGSINASQRRPTTVVSEEKSFFERNKCVLIGLGLLIVFGLICAVCFSVVILLTTDSKLHLKNRHINDANIYSNGEIIGSINNVIWILGGEIVGSVNNKSDKIYTIENLTISSLNGNDIYLVWFILMI